MFKYLLCAILGTAMVLPAFADVAVQGEGKVSAEPDVASVSIGVVGEDAKATKAMEKMSVAANDVFNALTGGEFKIDNKDLCTHQFSLSPKYKYEKDKEPVQVGFVASTHVTVKVRDLKKLGSLLDVVVKSGANTVDNVSFAVNDTEKILDEARKKAVADALRKAKLYVEGLNAEIGVVKTIAETERFSPRYMDLSPMAESASPSRMRSPRLAAGEREFRVNVSVIFTIKHKEQPTAVKQNWKQWLEKEEGEFTTNHGPSFGIRPFIDGSKKIKEMKK